MRVLITPDRFAVAGLTAAQVGAAVASGWSGQAPLDAVTVLPLSDGGPGFVDVIAAAVPGDLVPVTVPGPAGADVLATLHVSDVGAGPVVHLDAAQTIGPGLDPRRDPTTAASAGLGALLRAAVDAGARRVVVGLGPASTNDGGAGALRALGAGDDARLGSGGLALLDLPDDALGRLASVRVALAGVELVAATDDDLPLLGFHGTSAAHARQRGATPEQAQQLEAALGRFADVAQRSLVAGRPLMGRGQAAAPGSGAGGGAAFALLLLGATRQDGVATTCDTVGLDAQLTAADIVVTVAEDFGGGSLHHGVTAEVSRRAMALGVPVVLLAGRLEVGRREAMAAGLAGAYELPQSGAYELPQAGPHELPPAGTAAGVAAALAGRAERVARTWSR